MNTAIPVECEWFRDRDIVRQLPLLYKAYALHGRLVERTGINRGGGFLFRLAGRIYGASHPDPVIGVRIDSSTLFVDPRDRRMFWALDELRRETPEWRVIQSLVEAGDTFVDIGANHGTYAVRAARLVGDDGLILAFEPQPRLAGLITRSLHAAGVRNFDVFDVACGEEAGTLDLYIPWILQDGSGSASIYRTYSGKPGHSTVSVAASTLDSCLTGRLLPGRVFIKMDVEGSELAVLRGARRTFEAYKPTLLFEVNPLSAAAAGHTPADILAFLGEIGYERFAECDRFPAMISAHEIGDLDDPTRQRNLVALPG